MNSFLIGSSSNSQIMDRHKILDKFLFRAVWTIGMIVTHPCVSYKLGKWFAEDSTSFFFYHIFIRLAGNEDSNKILDFSFVPDWTIYMRVTCV